MKTSDSLHCLKLISITALSLMLNACQSTLINKQADMGVSKYSYYASGKGKPTLVLQSGLGDGISAWEAIVPQMREQSSVFAYDRLGYGKSSPFRGMADPCSVARELHALLQKTGISPPYVLLGHSLGGLYQYRFAQLYPEEVAGMVLLDPSHPDQWTRIQSEAPRSAAILRTLRATVFSHAQKEELDQSTQCKNEGDLHAVLPHVPVHILWSSERPPIEKGEFETLLNQLRKDWQTFLPQAQIKTIPKSGHYIHHDQPQTVIDTTELVLREVRKSKKEVADSILNLRNFSCVHTETICLTKTETHFILHNFPLE